MQLARLLFPAIRWDARAGYQNEVGPIEAALELGVGGFCLFGGAADAVLELAADLRARSRHPLLIASDLERGAGQQFIGATSLPPLAAFGHLDDVETTRAAAALTAREALALGVNWIFAPVADVDLEPRNPIVGSRAFGTKPELVARHVVAWIRGCHDEGAICCAKHFPGHGRTTDDSHAKLPRVTTARGELEESDLRPFGAAISAGVDSVMTAHVSFPSLDPTGTAATLSPPMIGGLLRRELGFSGLIVTDALIMEGVLEAGAGEAQASVAALAAGCDALLYPRDLNGVLAALEAALDDGLSEQRAADAIERIAAVAARTTPGRRGDWGTHEDRAWATQTGARSLVAVRGDARVPRSFQLLTIDDDLGGPYATPARDTLPRSIRAAGHDVREVETAASGMPLVVALYSDIRGWKGRPGLSEDAKRKVAEALAAQPDALVVLFGHPRIAAEFAARNVLAAWGGEPIMQEAVARHLSGAS
jgi:beta-glucosidase